MGLITVGEAPIIGQIESSWLERLWTRLDVVRNFQEFKIKKNEVGVAVESKINLFDKEERDCIDEHFTTDSSPTDKGVGSLEVNGEQKMLLVLEKVWRLLQRSVRLRIELWHDKDT